MKKILFLGFNTKYVHPYTQNVINILGSIMDLKFYGPGFSTKKDLDLGVDKWIVSQGQFDYLVIDSSVVGWTNSSVEGDPYKILSMNYFKFEASIFFKFVKQFHSFFIKSNLKKIIIANWDPYNLSDEIVTQISISNSLIIDFMGESLSESIGKLENTQNLQKVKVNDNWYDFIKQNKERIITFPHFINSLEFDFSTLDNRTNNFAVIGAGYIERKEAIKLATFRFKIRAFLIKIWMYIHIKFIRKMTILRLVNYQTIYFKTISNSVFVYCSGGWLSYPVRKYFEIPSRGSVAIGRHCWGFSNLGFVDGENFLIAKNNTELEVLLKKYTLNELQKIATDPLEGISKYFLTGYESHPPEQYTNTELEIVLKYIVW